MSGALEELRKISLNPRLLEAVYILCVVRDLPSFAFNVRLRTSFPEFYTRKAIEVCKKLGVLKGDSVDKGVADEVAAVIEREFSKVLASLVRERLAECSDKEVFAAYIHATYYPGRYAVRRLRHEVAPLGVDFSEYLKAVLKTGIAVRVGRGKKAYLFTPAYARDAVSEYVKEFGVPKRFREVESESLKRIRRIRRELGIECITAVLSLAVCREVVDAEVFRAVYVYSPSKIGKMLRRARAGLYVGSEGMFYLAPHIKERATKYLEKLLAKYCEPVKNLFAAKVGSVCARLGLKLTKIEEKTVSEALNYLHTLIAEKGRTMSVRVVVQPFFVPSKSLTQMLSSERRYTALVLTAPYETQEYLYNLRAVTKARWDRAIILLMKPRKTLILGSEVPERLGTLLKEIFEL